MAGGAGLATLPAAQAVPAAPGAAGTIQTMGGVTRNYQQGGYGPEGVNAKESQFQNPRGLAVRSERGPLHHRRPEQPGPQDRRQRHREPRGRERHHLRSAASQPALPELLHRRRRPGDVSATLNEPHGVAVDSEGNVYIADSQNCVIRKVDTAGIISTYAGTGQRNPNNTKACVKTDGTAGRRGPAHVALDQPKSLFMTQVSGDDTLWIADMGNSQIRKIDVDSATPQNIRVAGSTRAKPYGVAASGDAKDVGVPPPRGRLGRQRRHDLRQRRRQQPDPQDRHAGNVQNGDPQGHRTSPVTLLPPLPATPPCGPRRQQRR